MSYTDFDRRPNRVVGLVPWPVRPAFTAAVRHTRPDLLQHRRDHNLDEMERPFRVRSRSRPTESLSERQRTFRVRSLRVFSDSVRVSRDDCRIESRLILVVLPTLIPGSVRGVEGCPARGGPRGGLGWLSVDSGEAAVSQRPERTSDGSPSTALGPHRWSGGLRSLLKYTARVRFGLGSCLSLDRANSFSAVSSVCPSSVFHRAVRLTPRRRGADRAPVERSPVLCGERRCLRDTDVSHASSTKA